MKTTTRKLSSGFSTSSSAGITRSRVRGSASNVGPGREPPSTDVPRRAGKSISSGDVGSCRETRQPPRGVSSFSSRSWVTVTARVDSDGGGCVAKQMMRLGGALAPRENTDTNAPKGRGWLNSISAHGSVAEAAG